MVLVCLSVSNLRKNSGMHLHEAFSEGWHLANEHVVKFWWQSGSRIRIATLVRRALAEVCTVPVLVVYMHIVSKKTTLIVHINAHQPIIDFGNF